MRLRLLTLTSILVSIPLTSWGADPVRCPRYFARTETSVGAESSIPPRFRGPLLRAFLTYLERGPDRLPPDFARSDLPIRQTIQFGDRSLQVVGVFGAGHEGIVYVVKTPEGLRTIKEFYRTRDLPRGDQYADLQILGRSGRFVMLEFVPGLPTNLVVSETSLNEFGMDYALAIEVSEWATATFVEWAHEAYDTVLDIRNGRLRRIDPH